MRIAILADIHGNLPALEAVVADLRARRPDAVYLAGDQVNRCPWSNEVMDLVAAEGWPMIAGNHELALAKLWQPNCPPFLADRRRFPDLWWTHRHVSAAHLATIRGLPLEMHLTPAGVPALLVVHGSPCKVTAGFAPDLDDAQLRRLLAGASAPVVIGAHTHQPVDRQIGAQRVLNPGSVGMPYNGDPRAQYMLLDVEAAGLPPRSICARWKRGCLGSAILSTGCAINRLRLRRIWTWRWRPIWAAMGRGAGHLPLNKPSDAPIVCAGESDDSSAAGG